jgi:hypothetical protein
LIRQQGRAVIHGVRQNLDHKNADHLFLRINSEFHACRAVPIVFADATHHPGFAALSRPDLRAVAQ